MNRDVIELSLAVAFLCILSGIGFAIWTVAIAVSAHANVLSALANVVRKPLKLELSNEGYGALKVEAKHSNDIGVLQVEVEVSNSRPLDVRLEPVELSNHIGAIQLQLEPLEILGGTLQIEVEKGTLPLEVKIESQN
jgi:hypothetical protein